MTMNHFLPSCRHRGRELGDHRFECRSPQLHVPARGVHADDCRYRCPYVDFDRDTSTANFQVAVNPGDVSVAVGILTAPRSAVTIHRTVHELRRAGFEQRLHLFAEPGAETPQDSDLQIHRNRQQLGLWDNWRSAAIYLLDNTESDFILMCEDDLLLCPAAAAALQHAIATLPHEDWGYASLYTPRHNLQGCDWSLGWQAIDIGARAWGALGYCYSRDSLEAVINSRQVMQHTSNLVDLVVSQVFQQIDRRCYFHVPSLAAHAGIGFSSLGHRPEADSLAVHFDYQYRGYDEAPEAEQGTPFAESSAPAGDNCDKLQRPYCDVVICYQPADVDNLAESVESILQQEGVRPIIHLINDGVPPQSDPGTELADFDCVFLYRNVPAGVGPFISTNRILKYLKSDYLAFQDANDIALIQRLARAIEMLEQTPADLYGAKVNPMIAENQRHDRQSQSRWKHVPIVPTNDRVESSPSALIVNGTMVVRRAVFHAYGGFANWLVAADIEFVERAIRSGARSVFDATIVAEHRLRGSIQSDPAERRFGSTDDGRLRDVFRQRIAQYGQPGVKPSRWGGLQVEYNGIGTIRVESQDDRH